MLVIKDCEHCKKEPDICFDKFKNTYYIKCKEMYCIVHGLKTINEAIKEWNESQDLVKEDFKEPEILPCNKCGEKPKFEDFSCFTCMCGLMDVLGCVHSKKEEMIKKWNKLQSEPNYLSFEEAIILIKKGKNVRHKNWTETDFISNKGYYYGKYHQPFFGFPDDVTLTLDELLDNKWLEVKEQKS